jgi:hypothetical protein
MMPKKVGVWLVAAGLLVALCALAPAGNQTVTPRKGTVGTEADGQVDAPKGADTSAADSIIPVQGQPKVTIITRLFKLPSGWSFKEFLTKVVGQKSLWVDVIPGEVDGYPLEVPTAGADAIRVNRVFDEGVTNAGGFPLQLEGNLQPPSGKGKPQDFYWAVKVAPMVAIQEIQGHPNNDLALNNEFIKQEGTVGVLKGFKVKYIGIVNSPASGDTYTWQYRGHDGQSAPADWTDFGTGLTFIRDENTVGDYDVRLKLSRGGQDYYSETRQVMVARVEGDMMPLVTGHAYTRSDPELFPHWIARPPGDDGIGGGAGIDFAEDSPRPENIKQGFIQGMEAVSLDVVYKMHHITWLEGSDLGAEATYYLYEILHNLNFPLGDPEVNDQKKGHYLQERTNPPTPCEMGHPFIWTDCPGVTRGPGFIVDVKANKGNGTARVTYLIDRYMWDEKYTLWLVVVVENAAENMAHYIPLKQQSWRLQIASPDFEVDEWFCVPEGQPGDASRKPTDNTTTTSDVNQFKKTVPRKTVNTGG